MNVSKTGEYGADRHAVRADGFVRADFFLTPTDRPGKQRSNVASISTSTGVGRYFAAVKLNDTMPCNAVHTISAAAGGLSEDASACANNESADSPAASGSLNAASVYAGFCMNISR